jgi:hypothetical protein
VLNPAVKNGRATMSSKKNLARVLLSSVECMAHHGPAPTELFFARIHYFHLRTDKRISQNKSDQAGKAMSRDGLVVVIFFALATALAMGFLAVALSFPELMPWYSEPSPPG